jgi:EmrB/QacA subfamily drug resistance transporter
MTTNANLPRQATPADAEPNAAGAKPAAAQPGAAAATTAAAAAGEARPPWNALPIILVPVFMMTLDIFIVNVAIPSIQIKLSASAASIQWIISGFALAIAAGLITAGRLGDLYGRRRMFAVGLFVFTAASAACGFAPNAGFLIGARVAQGLGGALMSPQALAILGLLYTGAHRAKAFAYYGLTMGFAGVFGQLIGGALIKANIANSDWRSIFLINVPVGLTALLLIPKMVPMSKASGKAKLDLLGAVLATSAVVAIVLPLIEGRQQHWPLWTWLCLAASVPLFVLFFAYQASLRRRGGSPLIDLGLFRERAFSVGLVTTLIYYSAMTSFFLIFALYLQQGQRLDPLQSGLVFLPLGVGFFAASLKAAAMTKRLGRQTLAVGALAVGVGYALQALTVHQIGSTGQIAWITPGLLIAGFGMGTVMAPLISLVLMNISPQYAAAASGVLSTSMQIGNALGVAIIGIVFYNALGTHPTPASLPHAFTISILLLIAFTVVVAVAVQFLTKRPQKA